MPVRKKKSEKAKNSEKEADFRAKSRFLKESGYQVRRERLKTGPGWRVTSGQCRLNEEKMIFIDSSMAIEDQIEFLDDKLFELGLSQDFYKLQEKAAA